MKQVTMLLIGLVLTAGTAYGDEEPGPNYEHLKPLEWLIGTWAVDVELTEGIPGVAEKGEMMNLVGTAKWGLAKNVMRMRLVTSLKGKQIRVEEGTIGWDAEKKQIVEYRFDSLGGRSTITVTHVDKSMAKSRTREVAPDGSIKTFTNTLKMIDNDTVESTLTDITEGGEKKPDGATVRGKRVK
jgi:hypothetical protein